MKVAASPRIYMGRCPKVACKLPVTSHFAPPIPSYQSRVTSHSWSLVHHRGILVFIRDLDAKDFCIFLIDDDFIDFRIFDRSFFRLDLSI